MPASSSKQRPVTTVLDTATSTCTPETVQRKHVFDIRGYSQHKVLGLNAYISSGTFTVGGYDWSIRYYPGGYVKPKYVSVYLELVSTGARVRASCDLSLVNQRTGVPSLVSRTAPMVFSSDLNRFAPSTGKFKKRSKLEASGFVHGDRLVIECVVTVFMYPSVSQTTVPEKDPPSDLSRDLAKLFESKVGADIGFVVRGEVFSAHRSVLALRSPVFMAELRDGRMEFSQCLNINDMQPAVFEALLYYIYNDSLPAMDDVDGERKRGILLDLVAAADRFAIQRLKLICESTLCRSLDAVTVVATLNLAEKHHCTRLREACLGFIASSVDQMK